MHYRIQYVELQEEEKSAHTISGPRCAQLPPFLDLFGKYLSQFFPTQSNSFSYSGKGSKKIIFSWILYFSWRVPRFISVAQNMQSSYFVSIRYMVSKILFPGFGIYLAQKHSAQVSSYHMRTSSFMTNYPPFCQWLCVVKLFKLGWYSKLVEGISNIIPKDKIFPVTAT